MLDGRQHLSLFLRHFTALVILEWLHLVHHLCKETIWLIKEDSCAFELEGVLIPVDMAKFVLYAKAGL